MTDGTADGSPSPLENLQLDPPLRLCISGLPNAGKTALFNHLIAHTSPRPTTAQATDPPPSPNRLLTRFATSPPITFLRHLLRPANTLLHLITATSPPPPLALRRGLHLRDGPDAHVDVVLHVARLDETRSGHVDAVALSETMQIMGPSALTRLVIVLTHGEATPPSNISRSAFIRARSRTICRAIPYAIPPDTPELIDDDDPVNRPGWGGEARYFEPDRRELPSEDTLEVNEHTRETLRKVADTLSFSEGPGLGDGERVDMPEDMLEAFHAAVCGTEPPPPEPEGPPVVVIELGNTSGSTHEWETHLTDAVLQVARKTRATGEGALRIDDNASRSTGAIARMKELVKGVNASGIRLLLAHIIAVLAVVQLAAAVIGMHERMKERAAKSEAEDVLLEMSDEEYEKLTADDGKTHVLFDAGDGDEEEDELRGSDDEFFGTAREKKEGGNDGKKDIKEKKGGDNGDGNTDVTTGSKNDNRDDSPASMGENNEDSSRSAPSQGIAATGPGGRRAVGKDAEEK